MTTPIAFFDFDGTLTRRDSLLPFLREVVGTSRFILNMASLALVLIGYVLKAVPNDVAKQIVLRKFLAGMTLKEVNTVGERFALTRLPALLRGVGMEQLKRHLSAGHLCVLVSASLDVYLEPWSKVNGIHHWITSSLEINADGKVSGSLEKENCYGHQKVKRIQQWLGKEQPDRIYAYGDSKADNAMLELADEGYRLVGDEFSILSK